MLPNTFVFAAVPSSVSGKFDSGEGLAVNGKDVAPLGCASFTIVIEPGKMTAAADSERSWFPPEPSRSINLVWYGDPGIATAELPSPQSARVAMCPPHASTGFATFAVKLIVSRADLSPAKPDPSAYE